MIFVLVPQLRVTGEQDEISVRSDEQMWCVWVFLAVDISFVVRQLSIPYCTMADSCYSDMAVGCVVFRAYRATLARNASAGSLSLFAVNAAKAFSRSHPVSERHRAE